ncbi:MAG TPA: O-antigen ligase family protein [Armatimonadota bacterium]|jgi:O-antigen ligase
MAAPTYSGVIPYEESQRRERRMQVWLLLGCLAVAGMGVVVGFELALAGAALLFATALLAPNFAPCLTFLLVISLGISGTYVNDYRIGGEAMAGPPLSVLDLGLLLLLASCAYHLLLRRPRNPLPARLMLPLLLFAGDVLLSAVLGLQRGYGFKPMLQDLRVQVYILTCIVSVALFITRTDQLRLIAKAFLVMGALLIVQQIGTFFASFSTAEAAAGLRDSQLATVLCVLCALIVLVFHAQDRDVIRPAYRAPYLLACGVALLLSFGRSTWAVGLLCPLVLLFLSRDINARARARMGRLLFVGGALVLGLAVAGPMRDLTAQRVDVIQSGQIDDTATLARLIDLDQAWTQFQTSPVLGVGLGLEYETRPTLTDTVITTYLHNSPLYYASKMGMVGLALLLWLYVAGSIPLYRAALKSGTESAALARAIFAFFVVFAPIGALSGNFNAAGVGPMVGIFLGVPWMKLHEREEKAKKQAAEGAGAASAVTPG